MAGVAPAWVTWARLSNPAPEYEPGGTRLLCIQARRRVRLVILPPGGAIPVVVEQGLMPVLVTVVPADRLVFLRNRHGTAPLLSGAPAATIAKAWRPGQPTTKAEYRVRPGPGLA